MWTHRRIWHHGLYAPLWLRCLHDAPPQEQAGLTPPPPPCALLPTPQVCNHQFHSECLQKWGDTSCPVCRWVFSWGVGWWRREGGEESLRNQKGLAAASEPPLCGREVGKGWVPAPPWPAVASLKSPQCAEAAGGQVVGRPCPVWPGLLCAHACREEECCHAGKGGAAREMVCAQKRAPLCSPAGAAHGLRRMSQCDPPIPCTVHGSHVS